MSERERTWHEEGRESVASDVPRQVRSIVDAAEALASAIREDAERRAQARLLEAERRLEDADREAGRRLDEARREADRLVSDRGARLAELSDAVTARAEAALARLESADAARSELDRLLGGLAEAGAQVAAERGAAELSTGVRSHVARSEPADRSAEAQAQSPAQPLTAVDGGGSPRSEPKEAAYDEGRPGPIDGTDSFDVPRQVAFQMAVAGSSRAEVATHLQRTFRLSDPHVVLNEVFTEATR